MDIGCGVGANAVWLAERGWNVTALDFAKAAIERGKQVAGDRGVDVEFLPADAASYKPTASTTSSLPSTYNCHPKSGPRC